MNIRSFTYIVILLVGGLFLFTACSTTSPDIAQLRGELNQKEAQIKDLSADNASQQNKIASLRQSNTYKDQTIEKYKMKMDSHSGAGQSMDNSSVLLPPQASPGECYARVYIPPTFRTETEQVVAKEESERFEIIPAKYGWKEQKVLVKEASERIEVEPAQYKWVEERVMVKPASKKLVEVPAKYGWKEEKILVKDAQTVWKKGRGPIEKVDHTTGEIMCLVNEPATYRTIRKRTLVNKPTTREVELPAEYKTIKKQVMVKPATRRTYEVPAKYKTMKVRALMSPPEQRRIPIPASYQTVTKTVKTSEGEMAWRRILCETNVDNDKIRNIQAALDNEGMNPGPIDGVIGPRTTKAINQFQRKHNLAVGGLTYETIKKLNVNF